MKEETFYPQGALGSFCKVKAPVRGPGASYNQSSCDKRL
jgi:hypothetical protein